MQGHIFENFWKKSIFPIFLQLYLVFVILYQKYYSVFSCKTFSGVTQVKLRLLWLLWSLLGLSCRIGRLEMVYDICKKSISEMYSCSKFFRTWSSFHCLDVTGNIPGFILSRQSNFCFCMIFVQITYSCSLNSFVLELCFLLSEFCCLSSVFVFCCLSTFVELLFRTTSI